MSEHAENGSGVGDNCCGRPGLPRPVPQLRVKSERAPCLTGTAGSCRAFFSWFDPKWSEAVSFCRRSHLTASRRSSSVPEK